MRAIARYRAQSSLEQLAADAPPPPFEPIGVGAIDAETEAWLKETTEQVANQYLRLRGEETLGALEQIAITSPLSPGGKTRLDIVRVSVDHLGAAGNPRAIDPGDALRSAHAHGERHYDR